MPQFIFSYDFSAFGLPTEFCSLILPSVFILFVQRANYDPRFGASVVFLDFYRRNLLLSTRELQ